MNGIKESRDSRVTDYPKDWEVRPLGDMGTFLRGKGISKSETVDSGIPCVRYGEIYTQHHYFIKEFSSFINKDVASKSERVYKGDLLFSGSGETMEEIGKSVALLSDVEAYAGGDIVILRPNNVDSLYLSYALNNGELANERAKLGQGHSVVHIYSKDLQHLKIPLPSKEEQQKVASILSTWDKAIELKEKLIELKIEQEKGLMQKLLTGEIQLFGFDGDFKSYKLNQVLKVRHGKDQKKVEKEDGKYPILGTGGQIGRTDQFLYNQKSVLIGRKGTIDKPVYMDKPFWTVDTLFYTEINEGFYPKYIYYLFNRIPWKKYNEATGVPSLSASTIGSIQVLIPSYQIQREIAQVLTKMDGEIGLLRREAQLLKEQKKGLMQNLLTGKIRVKF